MARNIVIVGGGAAGTFVAVHLACQARDATQLTVVEPRERLAEGIAYGTNDDAHLLNVPADGMSAYEDDALHFTRWAGGDAGDFVARSRYAGYLRDELYERLRANRNVAFRHVRDSVTVVEPDATYIETSQGDSFAADAVVLALGNAPPARPAWLDSFTAARVVVDPWAPGALDGLTAGSRVLCVGTGLTFVDIALTLARSGARVTGVSRHGLLPQVHATSGVTPSLPANLKSPVEVSRWIRSQPDWRAAFAALRPATQQLWRTFSHAQQSQFLRHARRYWDVHRHRMSAAVADELRRRITDGAVEVVRGDARALADSGDYDTIVLCTGPDDGALLRAAPLAALIARGTVCAGPHGMGIATDADTGQVVDARGGLVEGLYAMGTLRRGTLWESTAVPEIRTEACRLAALLLS